MTCQQFASNFQGVLILGALIYEEPLYCKSRNGHFLVYHLFIHDEIDLAYNSLTIACIQIASVFEKLLKPNVCSKNLRCAESNIKCERCK